MSPQFVDFTADGQLDIVAGIFDGSPHLARGTAKGFAAPESILDRDGQRIVMNAFWNFDTKKWDETARCDPPDNQAKGHLTSAVAHDFDGDGDFDLLLGDHSTGRVMLRANEGAAGNPQFATRNQLVLADGKPIDVPGTVATLRLVDWNGDGRLDLACGGMGDVWGQGPGGGIVVYPNTGTGKATTYGAPITLLEPSPKGMAEPTRPDAGIYMDFADLDQDGDLDLVVGGYSLWTPPAPVLDAAQKDRLAKAKAELATHQAALAKLNEALATATEGLADDAATAARTKLLAEQKDARQTLNAAMNPLRKEVGDLEPGSKRESFVWYYRNLAK